MKRFLSLSLVRGPQHPLLETRTLPDFFASEILKKHSRRPALICRSESLDAHSGPQPRNLPGISSHLAWDFEEFYRHIEALARGLLSLGVRKGDRIGVIMGNNSAYAVLQWACAYTGAILVTINPAYRSTELIRTFNLVGIKHLFIVPRIRTSSYLEILAEALPTFWNSRPGDIQDPVVPRLRNIVVYDNDDVLREKQHSSPTIDWRQIMIWRESSTESRTLRNISASLINDDVINLQFTSGTTGSPKAVSLTHSNLVNNALSTGRCMKLTERDILCNVPPLFHCFDKFPFALSPFFSQP